MTEFCVKYGALHETTHRHVKSLDAAISAAAEKWWPPTDVMRDYAVIVEVMPDGNEKIVIDTPKLLTLIQASHTPGPHH
jgi:hypothetical protein